MSKSNRELEEVVKYMKSHWPSRVKPEWQVDISEYPTILGRALQDLTEGATNNRQLIRIAGLSGSGKTTQILPAVEAYCDNHDLHPVLVAARCFVEYHPHYQEIKEFYGDSSLRKMTDEFSTIMLFLSITELIKHGFDIILDVTLLDPKMEGILLKFLQEGKYDMILLMIAISPSITENFLKGRAWRHTKETEAEFIRATTNALSFYAKNAPEYRIILWSVYDQLPIYDGKIKNSLDIFTEYSSRTDPPKDDDDARREAKIDYLKKLPSLIVG